MTRISLRSPADPGEIVHVLISCEHTDTDTHLYSGLRQVDLQSHFLAHEDVGVTRFGEQRLQDVELRARERGPLPPLLPGIGFKNVKEQKNYNAFEKVTQSHLNSWI